MARDNLTENPSDEAFSSPAEQWEPWETKLVALSVGVGIVGLVLLGWVVDYFILP